MVEKDMIEKLRIETILMVKRQMKDNEKWSIGAEFFDKKRIINELENKSEWGEVILLDLILLTLDLVIRGKNKTDNIKIVTSVDTEVKND